MSGGYRTSRNIWKPLVLVVNTGLSGSTGATQFALPMRTSVSYQGESFTPDYRFKVDWGDGIVENLTLSSQVGRTHSYTASGTYSVSIYGRCDALDFQTPSDSTKILRLNSWGNVVNKVLVRNFTGARNLISVTSSSPILERTTVLEELFSGCTGISSIDLSNWNVSRVTSLYRTFYNCTSLNQLQLNWNLSKVTNMEDTFFGCAGLTAINITNVSSVTRLYNTFQGCTNLFDMDVSGWNVSNVTTMFNLFSGCNSLNPQVSGWDLSNVTSLANTFFECGITSVTASNWNLSNVNSLFRTFNGSSLTTFYAPYLNLVNVTTAQNLFQGCGLTGSIEISSWTLSSLQNAVSMFAGTYLRYFDSSGMKITTSLTNISTLLNFNSELIAATISNLINNSGIGGPFLTFANCGKLTSVDTVNWTRKMTTFQSCFLNCTSLDNIDVTTWDTGSVSSFQSTFENCQNLTTISCSNWTMSSVTTAANMFKGVTLSTSTYDSILTGWTGWTSSGGGTATITLQNNVQFHAGTSKYTTASDAAAARNFLITVKNWTITDGGFV